MLKDYIFQGLLWKLLQKHWNNFSTFFPVFQLLSVLLSSKSVLISLKNVSNIYMLERIGANTDLEGPHREPHSTHEKMSLFSPSVFFPRGSYQWIWKILYQNHMHALPQLVNRDQYNQKLWKACHQNTTRTINHVYPKIYNISLLILSRNVAHYILFKKSHWTLHNIVSKYACIWLYINLLYTLETFGRILMGW